MKRLMLILLLGFFCPGCALYMSEGQYEKGVSLTPATSFEWSRVQQNKLALEKVQNLPAYTASVTDVYPQQSGQNEIAMNRVTLGFKGYLKNASTNRTYNIKVNGPEDKAWLIPPGVQVEDYLIPGDYVAQIYYGGDQEGRPWRFRVSADLKYFEGRRDAHWYLVAQW